MIKNIKASSEDLEDLQKPLGNFITSNEQYNSADVAYFSSFFHDSFSEPKTKIEDSMRKVLNASSPRAYLELSKNIKEYDLNVTTAVKVAGKLGQSLNSIVHMS